MLESVDPSGVVSGEPFNITVSEFSLDTTLCLVAGEIDLLTGPTLRAALIDLISSTRSNLVIDLSAVRFLASIGLNILVEALSALEDASRSLAVVVGDNPTVTNALQTTGLDQVFDLHATMATVITPCPAERAAG